MARHFRDLWENGGTIPEWLEWQQEFDALDEQPSLVGHGWDGILGRLHERLSETDPGYGAVQIKEKFAALRIYFAAEPSDEGKKAVTEAEAESLATCEACGAPGVPRGISDGRWLKTMCETCAGDDNRWDRR